MAEIGCTFAVRAQGFRSAWNIDGFSEGNPTNWPLYSGAQVPGHPTRCHLTAARCGVLRHPTLKAALCLAIQPIQRGYVPHGTRIRGFFSRGSAASLANPKIISHKDLASQQRSVTGLCQGAGDGQGTLMRLLTTAKSRPYDGNSGLLLNGPLLGLPFSSCFTNRRV